MNYALATLALIGFAVQTWAVAADGAVERTGSVDEVIQSEVAVTIKAAIDSIADRRRRLGFGDRTPKDGTSCDCAKDALAELSGVHEDVLQHVPLTMMGILESNKGALSPNGRFYEPVFDYERLVASLETIWLETYRQITAIQCGPCDVDDDKHPEPPHDEEEGNGADANNTLCPGINHHECCCDVKLIVDIASSRMRALVEIVMLNPMAANFTHIALDSAANDTIKAVDDIAKPYNDCACPCITRGQLEAMIPAFQFCGFDDGDLKYTVDFNGTGRFTPQVCVSDACEGPSPAFPPPTQVQCWVGLGEGTIWDPPTTIVDLNTAEETACKKIIVSFCASQGDPVVDPFDP